MKTGVVVRGLLSGASILALTWSASTVVQAGEISGGTTAAVTVTAASATDFIWIHDNATVTGDVTNAGTITNLNTPIGDAQTVTTITAVGTGTFTLDPGIYGILVQEDSTVGGAISNSGTIDVDLSTSGTSNYQAAGIVVLSGPADDDVTVSNSGSIDVTAVLTSAVAATDNNVTAAGVIAFATGTGELATNSLTNTSTGTISVTASITGTGAPGGSEATAAALGVFQYAQAQNAAADLVNDGTFTVLAIADDPSPYVGAVANGIGQVAAATGLNANGDGDAAVSLTNGASGTIDVTARRRGNVAASASASVAATVFEGVFQGALGDGSAVADLTNSGAITVLADAVATFAGSANAFAQVFDGIDQNAVSYTVAGGNPDLASVTLTNSGTIDVRAQALASGGIGASAGAQINDGIDQAAEKGDMASVTLTNDGSIAIAAIATAEGFSNLANARAIIQTGIEQDATAAGDALSATVVLTNTGTIDILAAASAIGGSTAWATASITSAGIDQSTEDAERAATSLTNSGTIGIVADAYASSTFFGPAIAVAVVESGIDQTASASAGDQVSASASLVNSGTLRVAALAEAIGANAYARASIVEEGIDQRATDADDAAVTLVSTSSGTIDIVADAKALATSGPATATAYIDSGIYQYAYAADDEQSTMVTLSNAGTIRIQALAHATGTSRAVANADIDRGVSQYAEGGEQAAATLTNSGLLDIRAAAWALATATTGIANANASISSAGISQYGSPSDSDQILGEVTLANSGTLNILAIAEATGASSANAFAEINKGIYQSITYGDTALVELTNTSDGTIAIVANAHAVASSGAAQATAQIRTGLLQNAGADGSVYIVEQATLDNAGTLDIQAIARATGSTSAYAKASITNYGIFQTGGGYGDQSIVGIVNSGSLSILADARASATSGNAVASATMSYGIDQSPNASDDYELSRASIANDGTLDIRARAWARGTAATAKAMISQTGIVQAAEYGDISLAEIVNAGTLNIMADAWASATFGPAVASATLDQGIYQLASATSGEHVLSSATLANDNGGALVIGAYAWAKGTNSAIAEANLGTGIEQYSYDGGDAETILDNAGALDIVATAWAQATDGSAEATAAVAYGIYQKASNDGAGSENSSLARIDNAGTLRIQAVATALGTADVFARASLPYNVIYQSATYGDSSTAELTNTSTGSLSILASARASATDGEADASATFVIGIFQTNSASEDRIAATASIVNAGTLDIRAVASATGTDSVTANAAITSYGIYQSSNGGDTTLALVDNSGTLAIVARAGASATGAAAANARAGTGIYQSADAGGDQNLSSASLVNSGTFDILADAFAQGTGANAFAQFGNGILQYSRFGDDGLASVANSSWLGVRARAVAHATSADSATASASVGTGIYQYVYGSGDRETATAQVRNTSTGTLEISAVAEAIGGDLGAIATASIINYGIYQQTESSESQRASVDNAGTLRIVADAYAEGGGTAGAFARARIATGIFQSAASPSGDPGDPLTERLEVINSASLTIGAYADAVGRHVQATGTTSGPATATASVFGIRQVAGADAGANGVAALANSGTLTIEAIAMASGTTNDAIANATGLRIVGTGAQSFDLELDNSGTLAVRAIASATGNQSANAKGVIASGGAIGGTFTNSGSFAVLAANPLGPLFGAVTGLDIGADVFTGDIVNTGDFVVVAQGSGAGTSGALGIRITDLGGTQVPGPGDEGTITNDGGTLFAGVSHDGGATYLRGTAIDVSAAPNPIAIALKGTTGDGLVFGDILLGENAITASDGETLLDGDVNPAASLVGTLDVLAGGQLTLANGVVNGPADVYVTTFTQAPGSVVGFQLRPTGGVVTAGSFNATDATVDGSAEITPLAGLYPDSFTVENVVTATNPITGQWTDVTSTSPLLDPTAIFNPNDFDIAVERVAFDAVAGLTDNQDSVAGGIENVYSTALDPDFAAVIGALFTQDGPGYANALDQLGGAEYAQGLQVALHSTNTLNNSISHWLLHGPLGTNGGGTGTGNIAALGEARTPAGVIRPAADYGMPTEVYSEGGNAAWVRAVGTLGDNDGDENGPGYETETGAIHVGADHALNGHAKIGALIGYVNTSIDFDTSNTLDYEGVQAGLYGTWEADRHYLIGNAVYGHYWNDARRHIPLIGETAEGEFDTDLVSLYGEYGLRLGGTGLSAIPFAAVNFVNAWTDGFTETGAGGANLDVDSSDGSSLATTLGLRLGATHVTADGATIAPELRLGWEHEFLDRYQTVGASFAAAPGSGFNVDGSNAPRDSAVLGVGITASYGARTSFSLGYDGRFNEDVEDHTVHARARHSF